MQKLEAIQKEFNGAQSGGKKVSLADLIVLGGCAAVEEAAKKAGHDVKVPFSPGRTDASQEQTDVHSFAVWSRPRTGSATTCGRDTKAGGGLLVDRAQLLTLTAPEMTVLVGGMRALNANFGQSKHGVFTNRPGDVDERFLRQPARHEHEVADVLYVRRRARGARSRDGRTQVDRHRVDLVFGSNSQLRALAEVYACDDSKEVFVKDFVAAWNKVMNLDRYDLA